MVEGTKTQKWPVGSVGRQGGVGRRPRTIFRKPRIPRKAKGAVRSISHPGISNGHSFSKQVWHLRKSLILTLIIRLWYPQGLKMTKKAKKSCFFKKSQK